MIPRRKVYLLHDKIYADLVSEGAYASRIRYVYGGVLYDIVVENDEFTIIEDYDDCEDYE